MKAVFLAGVFAFATAALAQDPGMDAAMQANQMAMQASQQANQMAMQASQQANQMAMQAAQQANQQAMQDAQNAAMDSGPVIAITRAPQFSVKAGKVAAGTLVKLKSPTHKAKIYYTTNGWSPTVHTRRYTGPVTINSNTLLQAFAIAPEMGTSLIAQAQYTVPGSKPVVPAALFTNGVLKAGTRIEMTTADNATSKTLDVGDKLKLALDQDVTAGGLVVLPKGTAVEGIVTQADAASNRGAAGNLSFEVHSLTAQGITVPLRGGESLDGKNHIGRVAGLWLIPIVGQINAAVQKGEEAVIRPGMSFSVEVTADTPLTAQAAPSGPIPPPAS